MLNRLFTGPRQARAAVVTANGQVRRIYDDTAAGVSVDTETALAVPALWRGVSLISDSVGILPIHAYRDDERLMPTPRLLERPNPLETAVETYSAMAAAIVIHGNYVAILGEPGPTGYPESFYPVNPDRVTIELHKGEKRFVIDGKPYEATEIFHVKGFSLPGEPAGLGIIAAQRQGIAAAYAVMDYAARYFDGGAMPSYAIKSDNPDLNELEAADLKAKWLQRPRNSREPVVLNASTSLQPLTGNAADSQLVEARGQAQTDAANIIGLPGHYVGAPNSSRTYSNLEAQSLEYLRWTLSPITRRIEAALSDYLPRGQTAKFAYDTLLRADTLTRYQAHQIALSNGFLTLDEVRGLENRPPLETGA